MLDLVLYFKSAVTRTPKGSSLVYHTGHLAADSASSPDLTMIRMLAHGLSLMGRVALFQKRAPGTAPNRPMQYTLTVLEPVRTPDFDTARKVHLESISE